LINNNQVEAAFPAYRQAGVAALLAFIHARDKDILPSLLLGLSLTGTKQYIQQLSYGIFL